MAKKPPPLILRSVPPPDGDGLSARVGGLYLGYLQRRLDEASLTPAQTRAVLDVLLSRLRGEMSP